MMMWRNDANSFRFHNGNFIEFWIIKRFDNNAYINGS